MPSSMSSSSMQSLSSIFSSSSSSCTPSFFSDYHAGANKSVSSLIRCSAIISTNETKLDCEPTGTYADASAAWTGIIQVPTGRWAQIGYLRYRNDGSSTIIKKRYAEVMQNPGVRTIRFAAYPSAGSHRYSCELNTATGTWSFWYGGSFWRTITTSGWIGQTGTRVDYNGEIKHKKTQMPGTLPSKCHFTSCGYTVAGGSASAAGLTSSNLILPSSNPDWGNDLIDPTPTDALDIWDKKP